MSGGAIPNKGSMTRAFVGVPINLPENHKGNLKGWLWGDYSNQNRELKEVDAGLTYSRNIDQVKGLSADATAAIWHYPNDDFDNNYIGEIGVNYSKQLGEKVSLDNRVAVTQLMSHGDTGSGTQMWAKMGLPITLHKGADLELTLTPEISAAKLKGWYGSTGTSHVTPGLNLGGSYKGVDFNAFVKKQDGKHESTETRTYSGVSIGHKF